DAVVYRMIAQRRASGRDEGDLLSMLLRASGAPEDAATSTPSAGAASAGCPHAGLNDEQVRDECVTIILAGHETTANALTYAWHRDAASAKASRGWKASCCLRRWHSAGGWSARLTSRST